MLRPQHYHTLQFRVILLTSHNLPLKVTTGYIVLYSLGWVWRFFNKEIDKMITEEYIKSKGYTRYNPTDFDKDIVLARYQKCFRDDKGKKYFINALKIDMRFIPEDRRDEYWKPYHFEYDLQVSVDDDEKPINLQFFSNWTLDKVEEFVEDFFVKMNINYYEIDDIRHTLPDADK